MLPKCVLANPVRGIHRPWRETLRLVKGRIKRWHEGELLQL